MDVFRQRLEDEYDANIIITAPTVPYKIVDKKGVETIVSNPTQFPDVIDATSKVKEVQEPIVTATIIAPEGEILPFVGRLYRPTSRLLR